MQLLHNAGVPLVTSLKQLATYTRSRRLAVALQGVASDIEKGQSLGAAMQNHPQAFSPLIVNIVQIGENTGHLSEAFQHLYKYLEFEASSSKRIKAALRYPIFVFVTIIFAIFIVNIFIIPTFAHFYANAEATLPWQTRILVAT